MKKYDYNKRKLQVAEMRGSEFLKMVESFNGKFTRGPNGRRTC